ncbi:zinc-binding alcohol dehydrogenase family protein [Marispirochaeta sp.]|uniref:zinc-binding alcohol dehydrogenase family protein n=1 Tax=Marispirochaeta sp. TaxID=2038653 RepID=UPI0029C81760|nr:zinc-binding alcohol dehydrogenase family protein [Marispirochaeta sp.]
MKYISINGPYEVEIKETAIQEPKEGEALLKMLYGGICGTDLSIYRGKFAYGSYPRIPGHEFSAEIVKIGKNDRGLKEGMLVTANPYMNCGSCYSCQRGLVNCCMHNETMGAQRDGSYGEFFVMPIERIYDGKGLPAKTLALIEPLCISFHGTRRASIKPGEKVLVIGSGTIGILAALSAKYFGAEVYVSDIAAERLKHAETLGVDGTILNDSDHALADAVDRITGGNGFDVAIEAVGLAATFQSCIDAAAFGGRVVLIGISKQHLDFDFTVIQKKELNVYGSRNALKEEFLTLIDLVKEGRINVEKVVSKIYLFQEAGEALAELDKNGGGLLKVLLKFD